MSQNRKQLKVLIDEMVYQKIMHFVDKSSYEVSGLGKIVRDEEGNIRVIDAVLLPQRNTHTTTDIEPDDVAKAMYELRESDGELRFWWHSHVNMSVFWSDTDMDTIKSLPGQNGWFVSTVFNKKREMKTAISTTIDSAIPNAVEPVLVIDDVPTQVVRMIDKEVIDTWDTEYEKNVTNQIPKAYNYPSQFLPTPGGVGGGPKISRLQRHLLSESDWYSNPLLNADGSDLQQTFEVNSEKHVRAAERPIHSVGRPEIDEVLNRRNMLEQELNEIDDELDVYIQMGLLTEEDRAGNDDKETIIL